MHKNIHKYYLIKRKFVHAKGWEMLHFYCFLGVSFRLVISPALNRYVFRRISSVALLPFLASLPYFIVHVIICLLDSLSFSIPIVGFGCDIPGYVEHVHLLATSLCL